MERITKRIDDTHACYAICEKECPGGIYADNPACVCTASKMAMKRLLEYEDTGLTPQEIMELKERDAAKVPREICDEYSYFICPFCSGEPVLKRDRIGIYCVQCTNCKCMTTFQFDFGEGEEVSKKKAADIWNRRDENESRTDKERNET